VKYSYESFVLVESFTFYVYGERLQNLTFFDKLGNSRAKFKSRNLTWKQSFSHKTI